MTAPVMRPPQPSEAAALHRLMTDIERADGVPMLTLRDEVDDLFDSPDLDPDEDFRIVEIDGELIGYGTVEHAPAGQRLERATVMGAVHPDHRRQGHGNRILDWQNQRAQERLDATDHRLDAFVNSYAYDFETGTLDLLERHGFARVRYAHELVRALDDVPAPVPIDGVTIRTWTERDHEAARLVNNAAFADHWGSTPRSVDSWRHMIEAGGQRLDLSFVAADDDSGELVGICLNGHYPDDVEVTGRVDGWVNSLATLADHRGRGIASALVIASLHAFVVTGFDHAMLGVDTDDRPVGDTQRFDRDALDDARPALLGALRERHRRVDR